MSKLLSVKHYAVLQKGRNTTAWTHRAVFSKTHDMSVRDVTTGPRYLWLFRVKGLTLKLDDDVMRSL